MTKLDIITSKGNLVVIQLLDNPFVHDFVKQLSYTKTYWPIRNYIDTVPLLPQPWNQSKLENQQNNIRNAIDTLNRMGLNFPVDPHDVVIEHNESGRKMLNKLHRHFTTGHRSVSHMEEICTWQDGTDLTFERPDDNSTFTHAVHEINEAVHSIESMFFSQRAKDFKLTTRYLFQVESWNPFDPNNDPQNYFFGHIKEEHFQYSDDTGDYDVWLPTFEIQGKDYLRGYFDYDDPTEWDITWQILYSGSFMITDKTAERDPVILDWLRSYGIEPGPIHCGIPLGNIVTGKEYVNDFRQQIQSLDIRD